ncbi:MAG: hypothetical protein WCT07_00710 [Candidatus Paceibacterota bacterium]|jgi:hypothetical protein
MASSFSVKNYFKKIYTPELITKLYSSHSIVAIFEITDNTPRKTAVDIMMDFYKSLSPSEKIDIEKELAIISTLSTKYAVSLFKSLLKEKKLAYEETQIECVSDHDKVLYYYLFNKDVFDEVMFFHDFYVARGYMLYEAKEVALDVAEMNTGELTREFIRIANKDDRATECDVEVKSLDGLLYISATFEGSPQITPTRNKETGEIDRTRTQRKLEQVRIVYLPSDKEVLISYTGNKQEKIIFLDTFLRVICASGYEDKVESFDLSLCKSPTFDFSQTNKGLPLLTWKIKNVALSFGGDEGTKKKIRLSLPSSVQENGLSPFFTTLDELGLDAQLKNFTIENVSLSFSFTDKEKADKNVNVSCSVSLVKSSLSPLFPYERYARTLLKQSGIDKGFIEQVKKEKDERVKKWEV